MKVLLIVFLIMVLLFGGGYLFLKYCLLDIVIEPGSGYDPKVVFEAILQNPIPVSVQNLQGDALTWQGYTACLRFNASDKDIDFLIQQGFKQVSGDSIIGYFQNPNKFKNTFTPPWNPNAIEIKECYEMTDIKNDWTHSGSKWLIIDRSKGEVYLVSIGC